MLSLTKNIIGFTLIGFSFLLWNPSFGQTINDPQWKDSKTTIITAKFQQRDADGKKVIIDTYKDCKISMPTYNGQPSAITIDIPDKYYIKDASIDKVTYESGKTVKSVSYLVSDENKMASVTFFFDVDDGSITSIFVVATDNVLKKPMLMKTFSLSEIKD